MPPTPDIKSDSSPLSLQRATLDRILEVGQNSAQPILLAGSKVPFIVIPQNSQIEELGDFVDKPRPQFIQTCAKMLDAASFSAYVKRYKDDRTLIYANVTESSATFVAVLDYHTKSLPEFCAHKVEYTTAHTPEFKTWLAANRKAMNQLEFATWLEDNQQLFVTPEKVPAGRAPALSGADLLELINTLHGKQDVSFVSGQRLKSGGSTLNYEEAVSLQGAVQSAKVELPDFMYVGLSPFIGAPAYQISARVKFRIEGRKLSLWLETIQLHKVISDSINLLVEQIAKETEIKPLLGSL